MREIVTLVVIVLIPLCDLVSAAQASAEPRSTTFVEDALVDIGGRRLHVSCRGTGNPTVILEAGLGESSTTWNAVQSAIAEITRVCAYDRAGRGQSDPDPRRELRTSRVVVDDLILLLRAAGIRGPYVLVGHSLGGAFIRLYASRFPQDTVGMVLVDSSHEDQFARIATVGYRLPLPPTGPKFERIDMLASLEEVGEAQWRSDIPLIVLSHGRRIPEAFPDASEEQITNIESVWVDLQRELASRSSRGRLVIARQSGHYVHRDQPDLVIDAIRQVVVAARRTLADR